MTLAASRTVHLRDQPIIEDSANHPALLTWNESGPFLGGGNINTPQISAQFTPIAGTLVIVCTGWGTNADTPTSTVIDSNGNVYTLLARRTTKNTGEIWSHYYTTSPGPITITITPTGAEHGGIASIRCLINASPIQTGLIATAGNATQQVTLSVRHTAVVYGIASNWADSTLPSPLLPTSRELVSYGLTDGLDSMAVFTSRATGTNNYGYGSSTDGICVGVEILHK